MTASMTTQSSNAAPSQSASQPIQPLNANQANQATIWQGYMGSSIGKAHIDSHLPNQDSAFYQQHGDYTVAVVCDGAGSARYSEIGSNFFANQIGNWLMSVANTVDLNTDVASKGSASYRLITDSLSTIRAKLETHLTPDATLRDYHATVTAILLLASINKALVIQVGDSPVMTTKFATNAQQIDYFTQLRIFEDDSKNEYVNETHFITQDNWQDFLRVEWLDTTDIDLIALMSDGCADLVLQGASQTTQVYRPFFGNLIFNLCQNLTDEQGNAIVEQAIANPATYRLTGDDKSLIVLLKNINQYQGIDPLIEVESVNGLNQSQATSPINTPVNSSVWHSGNKAPDNPSSDSMRQGLHQQANQGAQLTTVNQPLNTTLPDTLPPSQPISDSGRQRRNTAVIATVAMVAGAGVLGWVNKDTLWPKAAEVAQTLPTTASVASATSAIATANASKRLSLNEPYTIDIIQADLTNEPLSVPFILNVNDVVHTHLLQGLSTNQATRIALNTDSLSTNEVASASSTSSSASSVSSTATPTSKSILTKPKLLCHTFGDKGLTIDSEALAKLGISTVSTEQQIYCLLQFDQSMSDALKQSNTPTHHITLLNGIKDLVNIVPGQSIQSANASSIGNHATAKSTAISADELSVYYLPMHAKQWFKLTDDANIATASTAQ